MSSTKMDKLVKAVNSLKQYYGGGEVTEKAKKDALPLSTKSDRQENCKSMVECILAAQVKSNAEYSILLGVTLETLLQACHDDEVDVRLTAEESLNRIIKSTNEMLFGKVLLEFYKEIKKNGLSRSLRAALVRFSNLVHKIRPNKCRPYIISLLPALIRISQRQEEIIQECLAASVTKIFPYLGSFAGDSELKNFLNALLQNLSNDSATIRRTAASCIFEVIKHARNQVSLLYSVMDTILENVATSSRSKNLILGSMVCLRYLVPLTLETQTLHEERKRSGSFESRPDEEAKINPEMQVMKIVEACIHFLCFIDTNVITSSLETLHSVLKLPNSHIRTFTRSRGLIKSPFSQKLLESHAEANMTCDGTVHKQKSLEEDVDSLLSELISRITLDQENTRSNDINADPSNEENMKSSPKTHQSGILNVKPVTDEKKYVANIEHAYEDESPAIAIAKMLCERILRVKGVNGGADVRVSVKNIALSCLGQLIRLQPKILLLSVPVLDDKHRPVTLKVSDVFSYQNHYDPHLRGCSLVCAAHYLASSLNESKNKYKHWLVENTRPVPDAEISIEYLVSIICKGLSDQSAITIRASISAVSACVKELLLSPYIWHALKLISTVLELKETSYWLVKVDMLELFSQIKFPQLLYVTESTYDIDQWKCYLEAKRVQEEIVSLGLSDLGHSDMRVRNAASSMIVSSITNMDVIVDSCLCDMATSETAKMCSEIFSSPFKGTSDKTTATGDLKTLLEIYRGYEKPDQVSFGSHNLSAMVGQITSVLASSTSKYLTQGCIQAIKLLTEKFPVSRYPSSYGCDTYLNVEKLSEGENQVQQHFGVISVLSSLLNSAWLPADVAVHSNVLILAGNYLAGSSLHGFQEVGPNPEINDHESMLLTNKGSGDESTQIWSSILDPFLSGFASKFFSHLLKLISIFHHIIADVAPLLQNKSVLPSLPTTQNIASPLKKKDKSESKDNTHTPEQTSHKKTGSVTLDDSEKEKLGKSSSKSAFSFAHSRVYMKVYELLVGAYDSYKTSAETDSNERFCIFLKTVLDVFCQILEIATFTDVERYAEEILLYLKSTFIIEPTLTVQAVQQLLKGLFGTNFVSQIELNEQLKTKTVAVNSHAKDAQLPYKSSLYHQVFHHPLNDLTMAIANASFHHYLQSETSQKAGSGWFGSIKKKVERKLTMTAKRAKGDKSSIQNYIRLFESIVIKSLKNYTMTSSVIFQKHVLNLLAQLVQLRVNYCLLDSDQIFIGFITKQFESIEGGLIKNSDSLIPHIFFFLVLLSYEKHHSKSVMTMSKIIQLCDGIMASVCDVSTHAIPALQPIVHDLFLFRGNSKHDTSSDLDTQREVIQSMLFRIIEYPEVLTMVTTILQYYRKENPEQWKRSSRQVTDILLPMLTHLKVKIHKQSDMAHLHSLFEALSPNALRPIDLLLNIFFLLPSELKTVSLHHRWMMKTLALLRVLLCHSNEDYILMRIKEMRMEPEMFSCDNLRAMLDMKSGNTSTRSTSVLPEEVLSRTFIQLIGFTVKGLVKEIFSPVKGDGQEESAELLAQQLSEFLLTVTYMCRSGAFKRLMKSIHELLMQSSQSDMFYSSRELCMNFELLAHRYPVVTLLWSQLLACVGYMDVTIWSILTGKESGSDKTISDHLLLNREIVHRGSVIMLADYISQNHSESELMSWLIKSHTVDLIMHQSEPPIQDFISTLQKDSSGSALLTESLKLLCCSKAKVKPSFVKKILYCVKGLHVEQSGLVLTLLMNKWFLFSSILALYEFSYRLACERVETLLCLAADETMKPTILRHINMLEEQIAICKAQPKYSRLTLLIERLLSQITNNDLTNTSPDQSLMIVLPEPSKLWYKNMALSFCCQQKYSQDIAKVLGVLDYDDIIEIMKAESFSLSHIDECIAYGVSEMTCPNSATVPYPEDVSSSLLKASLEILMFHVDSLLISVPSVSFDVENCMTQPIFDVQNSASPMFDYWQATSLIFQDETKRDLTFQICKSLTRCFLYKKLIQPPFEILSEMGNKVIQLCTLCFEIILCYLKHGVQPPLQNQIISVEYFLQGLQFPKVQSLFYAQNNVFGPLTIANCLFILMKLNLAETQVVILSSVLDYESPRSINKILKQSSSPAMICLNTTHTMEKFYESELSNVPAVLVNPVKMSMIQILSHPFFNNIARVPSSLMKSDMLTEVMLSLSQEKSGDYLQEKCILKEFVNHINNLGWISRMQFEETWTSLLGVLVSQPIGDSSQNASPMDEEAISISCLTIRALTALVVNSCMRPQGGKPGTGAFQTIPRATSTKIRHTKIGRELVMVQCIIDRELRDMMFGDQLNETHSYYQVASNSIQISDFDTVSNDVLKSRLQQNIERRGKSPLYYGLGQRSVQSFRSLYNIMPVEEDTSEYSTDDENLGEISSSDDFNSELSDVPEKREDQNIPSPVRFEHQRVDAHSCVQFLIDLFSEWFHSASSVQISNSSTGNMPVYTLKLPRQFLCECLHSLLLVSDFFTERQQFEWMFSSLNSLQLVQPSEDEVMLQYLVLGMCKAGAVLGMTKKISEIVEAMLDAALGSSLISCQTFALQGALYILECDPKECLKPLINTVSRYVYEKFKNIKVGVIFHSEQLLCSVISVGFYLIERWSTFITSTYATIFIKGAISLLSTDESALSDEVYYMLMKSLETLVTSYSLSSVDCDAVAKLAADQFSSSNSLSKLLLSLNLILGCMYYRIIGVSESSSSAKMTDTTDEEVIEARLLSMERITLLFDKVRSGFPHEARIIIQLLPRLLDTFFSTQDRMNKVIGEFVSSLHPFPNLIATVVNEVFQTLHSRGESSLVCEWVMLSLGNFTQKTPISTAVWCLTCIFISASTNHWINSLLPVTFSQLHSSSDERNYDNFYVAAHDFYTNQLTEELDRRSFHSIFKAVAVPGSPYQNLLDIISKIELEI